MHRELGPGLLEHVYEAALAEELRGRGYALARQVAVRASYKGVDLGDAFRADLVVEQCVIVEIKAVSALAPVHRQQTMTYLRFSGLRLALLVNFGAARVKDGFERFANALHEGPSASSAPLRPLRRSEVLEPE